MDASTVFFESEISRLSRVLRMQSSVNAAVLRIRSRDELLREACRLAVDVGGYDFAAVSILEPCGRRARPQYVAGRDLSVLPQFLEVSDGIEPDTSLAGRSLRTGNIEICNDLTQSESVALVFAREALYRAGVKSMVALPLIVDGRRVGVLSLTSKEAYFVRDEELLLLQDMMGTLSFALRWQQQADTVQLLAYYDSLTGLGKRAVFCERLDHLLAQGVGAEQRWSIAAFDVHHLSHINDSFGRHFGDLLLEKVAERLKGHADDTRVGYLGGGTFVLVEPEVSAVDESLSACLETTVFGEPFCIEGREIRVSCRFGVARYPADGTDSSTLTHKAEAALKHAKEAGEPYLHYKLEMHSEIARRLALEHKLRRAIDERQFELYYQPQLDIRTRRVESVEALLRWNDPENGVVPPSRFLSVLESSGMIVPVGEWVLRQAAHDCLNWSRRGLGPLRVAVNVSALQIRRRTFVQQVLEIVRNWPPEAKGYGIDIEITETVLLQDLDGTSRKLRDLRAAGIRIALDDFGTGYSSLGHLSRLPVDVIKIDRTFVSGLPNDSASTTLVEGILRIATAFQLGTVAEGVETPAQLQVLKELNCDQSQGFLHCPPVSIEHFELFLVNGRYASSPRDSA